jgi:photosystem II stability/assembly factor-like uncharacterized protein
VAIEPEPFATPPASSLVDDGGFFGTTGWWVARPGQLFLSSDRGATWVERRLVPSVVMGIDQPDGLSNVFVLDAEHAWSASPGPGSTPDQGQGPGFDHLHVVVNRTSDGGRTWIPAKVPGDWGDSTPVLAFASARVGYLLLAGLRGGGASVAFATSDGGATWRKVGGAGILGAIFGVTGTETLWSGNQGDAGPVSRPILDVSRDGGRTWVDARLPGLVGDIYVTDTLVAPPVLAGSLGALAVELGSSSPGGFRFYRTTDGGLSWVQAAAIAENDVYSVSVAVIDPTHFVALDPVARTVSSTSDAGATWITTSMTGFTQPLRLNFWDPEQGGAIALVGNGPGPGAGLFTTSDDGRTWSPVSP